MRATTQVTDPGKQPEQVARERTETEETRAAMKSKNAQSEGSRKNGKNGSKACRF